MHRICSIGAALTAATLLVACTTVPPGAGGTGGTAPATQIDAAALMNAAGCLVPLALEVQAIAQAQDLNDREKAVAALQAAAQRIAGDAACVAALEALRRRPAPAPASETEAQR